MASDLQQDSDNRDDDGPDGAGPKKGSQEILRQEIDEGTSAFGRPFGGLFMSGLSAGLDVGFSVLLMAVMETRLRHDVSKLVGEILVANMYSVGFIFVVIGRSELFTEQTTLAVLPVLSGQAPLRSLARLWSIVYVSNLLGAILFAALAVLIGPALGVVEPALLEPSPIA